MSIELNERLARAITDKETDYDLIKELIKQGADPLGALNDENETPIGNWFSTVSHSEYDDKKLSKIMQTFVDCGFDCARFMPDDDEDKHLELWSLTFAVSEGACAMLKIMLDNGLAILPLEDFISHFFFDCEECDGSYISADYLDYLIWALKMVMLSASYPRIRDNSEYLRSCIEFDGTNKDNKYPLDLFRDYDNYEYWFDFSTMDNVPYGVKNATVKIYEKEDGKLAWTLQL